MHVWKMFENMSSAKVYACEIFLVIQETLNACPILKIFPNVVGNCLSYVKILESQVL